MSSAAALVLFSLVALGGAVVFPLLDRHSVRVRILVIAFSASTLLVYLWWRGYRLVPFEWSPWGFLFYGFFGLECIVMYNTIRDIFSFLEVTDRRAEADRNEGWWEENLPLIDVLVPTYNESWRVLEKTLTGVKNLDYPRLRIWLLDDGRRDWLKARAAELDIGYLTRPTNLHYKAGNLNNALEELKRCSEQAEYICVFDADFVAFPNFLRRTLALMKDERVGIVQTPQWFYNPDPFQFAFGGQANWPDEQRAFFDVRLAGLDAAGAAFCCGSSFLLRMQAIRQLDGFPTSSLAEDMLCSVMLRRLGWKTIYLNEPLSVGLAPEGLHEFIVQRTRWMIGGLQVAQIRWSFQRDHGPIARFHYYLTLWRFALYGASRLGWYLFPIVYWFTSKYFAEAPVSEIAFFMGLLYVERFALKWLTAGRMSLFTNDATLSILAPLWLVVSVRFLLLPRDHKFTVTNKGVTRRNVTIHWQFLGLYLCLGGAMLAGAMYTAFDTTAPAHGDALRYWNYFMCAYHLFVFYAAAAPTVEGAKLRKEERFRTSEKAELLVGSGPTAGIIRDLSVEGALVSPATVVHDDALIIHVSGVGELAARVRRRRDDGSLGIEFVHAQGTREAMIRKIFCGKRYVPFPERWSLSRAGVAVLARAFR